MAAETSGPDTRRSDFPALSWWVLIVLVLYVVAATVLLCSPLLTPDRRLLLWTWSTLPAQSALVACGWVLVRSAQLTRERRLAWSFVMAALSLNLAGSALWMWEWTVSGGVAPHTSHVSYLLSYVPLGVIGLYFFLRDLGGSVRHPGVLLDTLALTLGFGAALWSFVIVPTLPPGASTVTVLDLVTRSAVLIFPAVFAGIVYTHVADWSRERGLACLLVAAVLNLCGDMLWASAAVPTRLGEALVYNLVFLVANVVGTLALCLEARRRASVTARPRTTTYSLVPALIILGCLIALAAADTPLSTPSGSIALCMLVIAAAALGLREILSQRELKRLERQRNAAAAVLDHEASDRAWLFDQVHEGVAQELAGLRMSLTASSKDPALAPQSLRTAIEQLGQTITNTRDIASRLAPLQSARGSLRLALESLQAEAATSGLPCRLESGALDPECPPATAELVHRIVRHVIESARTDASLQSLGIRITPGDESLAVHVHARSGASTGPMLDHPGWSSLHDRLHVAGGQATGAATSDGWWFAVRVPCIVAGSHAG